MSPPRACAPARTTLSSPRCSTRSASRSASTGPHTLEDLEDLNFDLIVTLAPEAHHAALNLTARYPVEVEYWPTWTRRSPHGGSREQVMDAYRQVRDTLDDRIRDRFRFASKATE